LDIEISSPKYEVIASIDKYDLLKDEELKVEYNIYGEDLIENGDLPLEIQLDDSLRNYEIYDPIDQVWKNTSYVQKTNLSSSKGASVSYRIKFIETGSFALPAIKIGNKQYPFEKEITIETLAGKYSDWFSIFFAFLSIFVSIYIGQIFGDEIDAYIKTWKYFKNYDNAGKRIAIGKYALGFSILFLITITLFMWLVVFK
jgi:hypothetical protein